MTARLATHMLVGALIRRVQNEGGFAMVLHRGDPISGVILLQCLEKGEQTGLFERISDYTGGYILASCGPKEGSAPHEMAEYIARRRMSDPDLWLIELDIADAERLAAESFC